MEIDSYNVQLFDFYLTTITIIAVLDRVAWMKKCLPRWKMFDCDAECVFSRNKQIIRFAFIIQYMMWMWMWILSCFIQFLRGECEKMRKKRIPAHIKITMVTAVPWSKQRFYSHSVWEQWNNRNPFGHVLNGKREKNHT